MLELLHILPVRDEEAARHVVRSRLVLLREGLAHEASLDQPAVQVCEEGNGRRRQQESVDSESAANRGLGD